MSRIHQINITYVAVEDRALLRLTTTERHEFRFWVTRRYASLLWPALRRSLAGGDHAVAQPEPSARRAVLAFQHEAALAQADFDSRFRAEGTAKPLGEQPALLVRLQCRRRGDGITVLGLHPADGKGIELKLDDNLLHSLLKLVADVVRAGDWGLDVGMAEPPETASSRRVN